MREIGNVIAKNYIPLDFEDVIIKSKKSNNSFLIPQGGTRERGTSIRTTSYINLHGQEFEETQDIPKSSMNLIEDQIDRLTQEYSESARVIWSVENTHQIDQILDGLCEGQQPCSYEDIKNEVYDNPLHQD